MCKEIKISFKLGTVENGIVVKKCEQFFTSYRIA